MPTIKRCRRCDSEKPITEFASHPHMADGHLNMCRECERKRSLEYRMAHLEERREYEKRRYQQIRAGTYKLEDKGKSYSRLYGIWNGIIFRCSNPKFIQFANYGGRGITVCNEWAESFASFREWAQGNGYDDKLQIDRIDNDGNYEPSNCRWVTGKQNCRNRSNNRLVTAFGETKSVMEWVDDPRCIVTFNQLHDRLRRGWSHVAAITAPTRNYPRKEIKLCP
jgi:hypothetical protein